MQQTLEIIIPVFGMAVMGYGSGRLGILDEKAAKGLSAFVFKLAIPIMLFRALGRLELPEIEFRGLAAYYSAAGLVYFSCAMYARRVLKFTCDESGTYAMGSAFANTVLLAFPIVMKVHGEAGTLPLLLIISCHTTWLFSIGTLYIETGRARGKGLFKTLGRVLKGLVTNPIVVGLLCGLLWNALGLTLPTYLDEICEMFGDAAVPGALFSMGLSLCGFKMAGNLSHILQLTLWKLFIHPAVMWVFATQIFHLSPIWTSVTVLAAAMPSGVNAYLFAASYETREATVAATVLLSTGLAMVTITGLLLLGI